MKTKFKFRKLLQTIAILLFFIYIFYQYYSQQQTLNSYASSQEYYNQQIASETKKNTSLLELQQNINSDEYIEQIAREKLDMYLPNERVYIDISQ
ncbi:MAG: septum formation initiator family protein [Oscillospiraceae bacterium]|nr:septum formation initiator family protein [Oscillospiraceae bacterium]